MKIPMRFYLLLIIWVSCSGMSSPQQTSHEHKHISLDTTKKKLSGAGYVKPHAGIRLDYQSPKTLQAGQSFTLDLVFTTSAQAESLHVSIKTDAGLRLDSTQQVQFPEPSEKVNKLPLQLTAEQDGKFFIDITAVIAVQGQTQVRSFAIPVAVGDVSAAQAAKSLNSNTPEKYKSEPSQGVVSMPAIETVE